jgi:hypothetical protein
MVSLLSTKFHEILFVSFRGVALTSCFSSKFREISKFKGFFRVRFWQVSWYTCIMSPPHFCGETYCFCPVRLSITQFVSATPLKLHNRISWNLVGSKDTICNCAYYQEILISWILWELCPFELRNFPKIYYWSSLRNSSFMKSKFPGNMHNYIWCPYYLPSFMKFCLKCFHNITLFDWIKH